MTDTSSDSEHSGSASDRSILLSMEELMVVPPSSRQLPDLSVSNDALRESLKPPPPVPLGAQVARVARARRDFALWWYGTRPAWLQVTLGGLAGSLLGLGVVLSYYVATLPPEPEVLAEPGSGALGLALAASAPLISERVVQALAPAAALDAPVEADAFAQSEETADEPPAKSKRRKSGRGHASKAQASSAALPSWVQRHVKPQARRAVLRDQKAAARARKAALRDQKAARVRARKSKTLAQK